MEMEWSVKEDLMAQAVGCEVVKILEQAGRLEALAQAVETKAVRVLEEIGRILDDDTLEDPACFRRIEKIVKALEAEGIYTARHDGYTQRG